MARWLERRRELGQDLYDEVWEGQYHVSPASHRGHGDIDDQVGTLLRPRARPVGLWPSSPANIGDPSNYRVPDRVYFRHRELATFEPTAAIVVEAVSPHDESYVKLAFYFARGVEEALIVDPACRSVQWYTRGPGGFARTGRSAVLGLTEADLAAEIDWPD